MPLPAQGMKLNVDGSRVSPLPTFRPYQSPSMNYQQQTPQPMLDNSQISQSVQSDNVVPAWQPPAQLPQQDQGTLFNQGQQSSIAIPSWQPPTMQQAPQTSQNPSMGSSRVNGYQSPSTRYLRNQRTF